MKIKQVLNWTIPAPGSGLKDYDIFKIKKGRALELKKLCDKKTRERMKPVTDKISALPKKATDENKSQIQEAMNGIIKWTAPRPFIETLAEVEVNNVNEANFLTFAYVFDMFNRMQTNQSMAVELNNMLKTLQPKPDGKDKKPDVPAEPTK